jgi:hypothetical protein
VIRILTLTLLCLAAPLNAEPPQVRVSTLDGAQFDAKWTGVNADGRFEFSTSDGVRSLSPEDVTLISFQAPPPTSMPARGVWVRMANGDQLVANIVDDGNAGGNGLLLDVGLSRPLLAPLPFIAAIRFGESRAAFEKDFDERVRTRTAGRDVLMLIRDGKTSAMPGALDKLDAKECSFRINDKVRVVPIENCYGVILGSVVAAGDPMPATLTLGQGSQVSAKILPNEGGQLRVDAGAFGKMELPWSSLGRIEFKSGRAVFISELQPDIRETNGIMGATWPVQMDKNTRGGAISLRGRTFARGLGVHADAAVSFKLDGQFERFTATVGIDDNVAPAGSVVFRVKLDGHEKFASPVLRGTDEPLPISVDVRGGQELTLEADMSDDLDISDHADWANAMLVRQK